ncbi:MAG: hypothetical protein ACO1N9_00775 [Flavobacterium sp.]
MKTIKVYLFAFLAAIAVTSCIDDSVSEEYCSAELETLVEDVTGPDTATVGQQVTLVVKFQSGNGCYKASRFTETATSPKDIRVFSTYIGCVCTEQTELISKDYKFTPTTAGEHKFRFKKFDNTFIEKTVTVTQ